MKSILILSRIIVGGLFVFSGLIKANDPLGFSYKLEEYFVVFGMEWMAPAALALSMFICIFEVVCGIAVLLGSQMQLFGPIILLMILFFTWLTGFSAYTGEVTDCGCFGDAIKLTPTESFIKDVILTLLIIPIFMARNSIQSIVGGKLLDGIMAVSIIGTTVFTLMAYWHLPMKDFRPYKVDANIIEGMNDGVLDDIIVIYIYKHKETGEVSRFVGTVPSDFNNWEYVDRIDSVLIEGELSSIHDFSISDEDGNDVTESFIYEPNYMMWVIVYDLETTNKESFETLNKMATEFQSNGMEFVCFTATMEYEKLRHDLSAGFPFYTMDETVLKTIIRSNPGLVLVKEGVIKGKWHVNDIPTYKELDVQFFSK